MANGQEQKPTGQAQPQNSLIDPQKTNYKGLIQQYTEQANQLSLTVTQLQSFVLQMKTSAPAPEFIDAALEALLAANKQLSASIQNVTGSTGQQQESFQEKVSDAALRVRRILAEGDRDLSKDRKFFIRQTEVHPKEQFEVREMGELSPVHVSRCPKTGDFECIQDEKVSRGKNNRYVEAVKQWQYRGRPKVIEYEIDPDIDTSNSATPSDSKLSGGGYERPGFWGTHQPVGYPDHVVKESYSGTDRLGKWSAVMGKHGFKLEGDCLYICRNSRTYVFVHPKSGNWAHRKTAPGLSVNGTGLKSLSEHMQNFSRLMKGSRCPG